MNRREFLQGFGAAVGTALVSPQVDCRDRRNPACDTAAERDQLKQNDPAAIQEYQNFENNRDQSATTNEPVGLCDLSLTIGIVASLGETIKRVRDRNRAALTELQESSNNSSSEE